MHIEINDRELHVIIPPLVDSVGYLKVEGACAITDLVR